MSAQGPHNGTEILSKMPSDCIADSPDLDSRNGADLARRAPGGSLFLSSPDDKPLDRRTKAAKRFEAILSEILSDLGGADRVSEGEFQLARRAAGLSVQCEVVETWLAAQRFDKVSIEDYCKLISSLNRTLSNIGLKRRARDVTPSLADIIEGNVE